MQQCLSCGKERHPKSRPGLCQPCSILNKRANTAKKHVEQLISMGYDVHTDLNDMWDSHAKAEVTNTVCNHRYSAIMGNILNGSSKCGVCGPKNRQQKMLAGYLKKFSRTYDLNESAQYSKYVRSLSNKNWIDAGQSNATRGHTEMHLDHKVPIMFGFKNKIPPEAIADIANLQLLPFDENIRKGCNEIDFETLDYLKKKYKFNASTPTLIGRVKTERENKLLNLVRLSPSLISGNGMEVGDVTIRVLTFDKEQSAGMLIKESKTSKTLVVFEDELLDRRRRIIESRINHELGLSVKIHARKCEVVDLAPHDASRFFESNHLGGRINSSVRLGLKYNGRIVAAMLFSKSRFLKSYEWELLRFANLLDTTVVGGASKLFRAFVKLKNPSSVVTYTGKVLGEAGVYPTIGMKLIKTTMPNTWWVKNGERINSQDTRPEKLLRLLGDKFDPTLGIETNMRNCGWIKLEDLGSNVFGWTPEQCASVENLQMLEWSDNQAKGSR